MTKISRRQFSRRMSGLAIGAIAAGRLAAAVAQDATPVVGPGSPTAPGPSLGYVSLRVRALETAALRSDVDTKVVSQFVPAVQALAGYQGYVLGDVVDQPSQSLSVVVLNTAADNTGFNNAAQQFIASLGPTYAVSTPTSAAGNLYIVAGPAASAGTPGVASPAATPVAGPLRSGVAAVRLYTTKPGADPRETVPLTTSTLLPILRGIAGFRGYLWFVGNGNFGAINLFDSQASAEASTAQTKDWVAAHPTTANYYTGTPTVINSTIVYADLPVLATHAS